MLLPIGEQVKWLLQCHLWPAGKRSAQTVFSFAHKGGDRQWSEAELPVAGKGASLLYIGALVLKCAMVGVAGMLVGAKAVHRFRGKLMAWVACGYTEAIMPG